ncbi:uncharacterized protein [Montipora capricornis]|uniref:uncharacterized protein isoform X2 n=1 Tax=Montipora capricornis TaxID=246305 RepID=UPI0035F11AD7
MHFSNMSRERFSLFGLFLLMTISGSSANLDISDFGESHKYKCSFNTTVVDSPDFKGGCLIVCMPNERQKFKDFACVSLGKTEDSMSSCVKHDDPVLYDCCRKNVKGASFHKLEDGSALFVIDTKHGPISNCGNFTQFNITSDTGGLTSSQVICTIMHSSGTAEFSSSVNQLSTPPTIVNKKTQAEFSSSVNQLSTPPTIVNNKTEGGTNLAGTDSSLSSNHAGTSHNKDVNLILIPFILMIVDGLRLCG